MIEEGGRCDIGDPRDLIHGRRRESLLGEQVSCHTIDSRADFEFSPFAAVRSRGLGGRLGRARRLWRVRLVKGWVWQNQARRM
jgi:hypothetical protein